MPPCAICRPCPKPRLPEDLKRPYLDIPWKQISGFRNILVHNYLGNIDPLTVQAVVQQHLPPLETAVCDMLARNPESAG
jgi:uncharacterized protein with HEPN domain